MTHLARSTLIIAFFFVMEKALGYLRYLMIGRQFQISAELDAFYAANNLPDLLFALISGGALAMAFIPVLSEKLAKEGRRAAWDLFSRIGNLVFLVTGGVSLVLAIFAGPLVDAVVTPGFPLEQRQLVTELMRLNLISTMLFSLAGLVIAGLQSNQHFWLPALAPTLYDVGTLIGVTVLSPEVGYTLGPVTLPAFGLGVHGLVYGTILGALLFLGVQVPGLLHYGFRWTPAINLRHPDVRKVLRLLGPRVLTMFFIHLVFLAQDNIASWLAVGSVSALVYGWLFFQFPESIIGTALGQALLPTLSEQITRQEVDNFRQTVTRAVRILLSLALPAMALLWTGVRPLVSLFNFDALGTDMVVWTTRAYLLGLPAYVLIEIAARSFYARQNVRIPLLASGMATLSFVALAIPLAMWLDAPGIALANALAYSGEATLLCVLLNRQYGGLFRVRSALLRAALAALLAAALVTLLVNVLPLGGLFLAGAAVAAGGLVALPFIWPELKLLIKL